MLQTLSLLQRANTDLLTHCSKNLTIISVESYNFIYKLWQ